MEAVPRLPMLGFSLLSCSSKVTFSLKLGSYINSFYNEDAATFISEIQLLEELRAAAAYPNFDIAACQTLKKYYCQLHFLKSRFPMEENQAACLQFSWRDDFTKMSCTVPDVSFEQMCILYNIGAMHTKLGAADNRSTPDGMKMACSHFQCAAWAFQMVRELYPQFIGLVIASVDIVRALEILCLAQAQECILEKSLLDNRKPAVVMKVAAELSSLYNKVHKLLYTGDDAMLYEHLHQFKYVIKYIQFKIAYYQCLALLYAGQLAEEQQQMGIRVAYYQKAADMLAEANSYSTKMSSSQQASFNETVIFTRDVVEGKRTAATKENEFIYHEEIPSQVPPDGQPLKGAILAKAIPFNVNDIEVAGKDIFGRLVPMEAHEASSLYSEQKAAMLRQLGEQVNSKDQKLHEYMSSLQLDCLHQVRGATGLCQELVDRAAAMCAKDDAITNLVKLMSKLADSYQEVESSLAEIQDILKEEDRAETEHQTVMGKRAPSQVTADLRREAAKYHEAHQKAAESNQALHKAMTSHLANLRMLNQPLDALITQIPSITLPDPNVDSVMLKELEGLVAKVDEMRTQRSNLWSQMRDSVHKDDITSILITRAQEQNVDELFERELKKHKQLSTLIEQNMYAQDKILAALTECYANFSGSRQYMNEILQKRHITITALIQSFDTYDDLAAKAQKGIEFYSKLETSVNKLLTRLRSICTVQQEEREQLMVKAGERSAAALAAASTSKDTTRRGPKLKDYLNSRAAANAGTSGCASYPPGVRPTPVGADSATITPMTTALPETDSVDFTAEKMAQLAIAQQYWQQIGAVPAAQKQADSSSYNANIYSLPSQSYNNAATPPVNYATNLAYNYTNQNQAVSVAPNYGAPNSMPATSSNAGNMYNNTSYTGYSNYMTNTAYNANSYSNSQGNATAYQNNAYNNHAQQILGYMPPAATMSTASVQTPYSPQNDAATYNYNNTKYGYNTNYYAPTISTPTADTATTQSTNMAQPGEAYVNPLFNTPAYQAPMQPQQPYPYGSAGNFAVASTHSTATTSQPVVQNCDMYKMTNTNYDQFGKNSLIQSHATNVVTSSTVTNATVNTQDEVAASLYYAQQAVPQYYNYAQHQQPVATVTTSAIPVVSSLTNIPSSAQTQPKPVSSMDLLSGLDFSVTQAPLVPQKENSLTGIAELAQSLPPSAFASTAQRGAFPTTKMNSAAAKTELATSRKRDKPVKKEPFKNVATVDRFEVQAAEFCKYVESLGDVKILAAKWKELSGDGVETDAAKRSISVARCYPLKNRCADTLPYDYSRIELKSAIDDYINASKIIDLGEYIPDLIATQAPLKTTLTDFWDMIWEQNVETIVCLLSDLELGEDIYWPEDQKRDVTVANRIISLQSVHTKLNSTERKISINMPDRKEMRYVTVYQYTSFTGSVLPVNTEPFVLFVRDVLMQYEAQSSHLRPILVHCLAGVGRTGSFCLTLTAVQQVLCTADCPDLIKIAGKLSGSRRNILHDRDHFKFTCNAVATFYKDLLKIYGKVPAVLNPQPPEPEPDVKAPPIDPFSDLDPLWATKRSV